MKMKEHSTDYNVNDYGDFYDQQMDTMLWGVKAAAIGGSTPPIDTDPNLKTMSKSDAINPSHYKNVACGKQYMELMTEMLSRFNGVEAHLMGQIYKYLMRGVLKDQLVQDLEKAQWYLNALIKWHKEGKVM